MESSKLGDLIHFNFHSSHIFIKSMNIGIKIYNCYDLYGYENFYIKNRNDRLNLL